jgi:hypothetical protein
MMTRNGNKKRNSIFNFEIDSGQINIKGEDTHNKPKISLNQSIKNQKSKLKESEQTEDSRIIILDNNDISEYGNSPKTLGMRKNQDTNRDQIINSIREDSALKQTASFFNQQSKSLENSQVMSKK